MPILRNARLVRFFAVAILAFGAVSASDAAVMQVTRADDPSPGTCAPTDCSLREAAAAAVATPEPDQIMLQAGQYLLSRGSLLLNGAVELRGVGADQTRVVGSDEDPLLRVFEFSDIVVQGIEVENADGMAIAVVGDASLLLRDVTVPFEGGWVGTDGQIDAEVDIRIENSRIADAVDCSQESGLCRIVDSELGSLFVQNGDAELELLGSIVGPPDIMGFGIGVMTHAPVTIRDSIVRNSLWPLLLGAASPGTAPAVTIERTRFLDNQGPMYGDRPGLVSLEDVEFRGHITSTLSGDPNQPSVLLAGPGPLWRLNRALIVGNRGGGTDGATIRILSGGRVGLINSTFDNNTFRADVQNGYGHGIGIYTASAMPALLTIFHSTLRRATSLSANAAGSLLTVRGPNANVSIANSLFRGTCAFGGGGSVSNAVGNIESPGTSCQLDSSQNDNVPELQLHMGGLADHGGFTHSYLPAVGSVLLDAAGTPGCLLAGELDQRGYVRDPDGIDCDVGAVEADAVSDVIFAHDFE